MSYFLDLFSPETYESFARSDKSVSGFRSTHKRYALKVRPGDRLVCYMTKLSRWCGLLEIVDGPFEDQTPLFYSDADPFTLRFRVRPIVWLPLDRTLPIKEQAVWDALSFTRGTTSNEPGWTGHLRGSLSQMRDEDGATLERMLVEQQSGGRDYPVDPEEYRRLISLRVRRADKDVSVVVPEERPTDTAPAESSGSEIRESIKVQALLAEIGARMGMHVWLPRADRAAVLSEWKGDHDTVIDRLPLNYDDTTLRTIEQIDVLWLKGRSIRRAFEVEHTTSIYSGILRMADLLALQPNMDIRLHIVAPSVRRDKVFQELRRPVFSLLDRGPLSESCSYLSYDSVRELAQQQHLSHLSDTVLDEYDEEADD